MEQHRNADPELPHIAMLVASGPFRFRPALFRGALSARVVVTSAVRAWFVWAEALRDDPRNRAPADSIPKNDLGPATFARLPFPLGTAPALRPVSVRRLVPSGFRVGSGGASPSAWRFQEHGLVSWPANLRFNLPKQSLPRVTWSRGNPSSDDSAPLAASAVREIGPKTFPACFPTLLTGIAAAPIRLCFSVQFQGFIPGTCGLASRLAILGYSLTQN
jgi:hypothetical protein